MNTRRMVLTSLRTVTGAAAMGALALYPARAFFPFVIAIGEWSSLLHEGVNLTDCMVREPIPDFALWLRNDEDTRVGWRRRHGVGKEPELPRLMQQKEILHIVCDEDAIFFCGSE